MEPQYNNKYETFKEIQFSFIISLKCLLINGVLLCVHCAALLEGHM